MEKAPKWYLPISVFALLWNLIGCAAYLSDVMLTAEDIAAMDAARSIGLIARKRWAALLLELSLAGVIVQDIGLFLLSGVNPGTAVLAMQGFVLLVAIGLVVLSRKAIARRWIV